MKKVILLLLISVLFSHIKAQKIVTTDAYVEETAFLLIYKSSYKHEIAIITFSDSINLENMHYEDLLKNGAFIFKRLSLWGLSGLVYVAQHPFEQKAKYEYYLDIPNIIFKEKNDDVSELKYCGIKYNENVKKTDMIHNTKSNLYKELVIEDDIKVEIYKICLSGIVFCLNDYRYADCFFIGYEDTEYAEQQPYIYMFVPFSVCE